jgi:hypothetical protein
MVRTQSALLLNLSKPQRDEKSCGQAARDRSVQNGEERRKTRSFKRILFSMTGVILGRDITIILKQKENKVLNE